LKVLERSAPKIKFSGKIDEMNFERFMERMEKAMDVEGVTDGLKLESIENWFSGLPLSLVKSMKDNSKEDATSVLQAIKEVLIGQFGSKRFDTEGMLKKMAEGRPVEILKQFKALLSGCGVSLNWPKGKMMLGHLTH
jgi:acylphosphatase